MSEKITVVTCFTVAKGPGGNAAIATVDDPRDCPFSIRSDTKGSKKTRQACCWIDKTCVIGDDKNFPKYCPLEHGILICKK